MEKTHFESTSEVIGSIPVLHMFGEVDIYSAPMFKAAITEVIAQGFVHIVLDMKDIAFMDSSGFGALLSASKPLRQLNGSLYLAACNDAITRMLMITRLNTIIPLHVTQQEAIERVMAIQAQSAIA